MKTDYLNKVERRGYNPVQQDTEIMTVNDSKNIFEKNVKSIKDIILPSGIDATSYNHLEFFAKATRYCRSFYVSSVPRMATFVEFLSSMYDFGDINVSIHIEPIPEAMSQNDLNKMINDIESEIIVAQRKGDTNRASVLTDKFHEADQLRSEIAAGFNKLYDVSIFCTISSYDLNELDRMSELLAMEVSKNLLVLKTAWAIQEDCFKSNLPLNIDLVKKRHTFDKRSVATDLLSKVCLFLTRSMLRGRLDLKQSS